MTEEQKKTIESQGGEGQTEEQKGASSQSTGATKTEEEWKQEVENLKKENSGIYKKMSEYEKEKKERAEQEEKKRLEGLSEKDRLDEMSRKLSNYEKKETWRNLCIAKGIDAEKYIKTALNMEIADLGGFADDLANMTAATKQEAKQEAKQEIQETISKKQPENSSKATEDDPFFKGLKMGMGSK